MSFTGIAALIAAVSFAVLTVTAVFLAARLARALGDTASLARETRASMDAVSAGLAELSGQVTALGAARGAEIGRAAGPEARAGSQRASGPSEPWLSGDRVNRAAALAYGVRHAVVARQGRNGGRRTLAGQIVDTRETARTVRDSREARR